MSAPCTCRVWVVRLFVRGVPQVHPLNDRLVLTRTLWHDSRLVVQTFAHTHARLPRFASICRRAVHTAVDDLQIKLDRATETALGNAQDKTVLQIDELKIPTTIEQRLDHGMPEMLALDCASSDGAKYAADGAATTKAARQEMSNLHIQGPAPAPSNQKTDQMFSRNARHRLEQKKYSDHDYNLVPRPLVEQRSRFEKPLKPPRSERKPRWVQRAGARDATGFDESARDSPEEESFSVDGENHMVVKRKEESAHEMERRRDKERQARRMLEQERQKERSKQRRLEKPEWAIQKEALREKFPEGWRPRKRLSPDALNGIRALNKQFPTVYNADTLSKKFEMSPEAIRRILRSKWTPSSEEEEDRLRRWRNRGITIWERYAAMGINPPKQWRQAGVGSPAKSAFGPSAVLADDCADLDERMSPEEFRAEMERKRRLQYQIKLSESLL